MGVRGGCGFFYLSLMSNAAFPIQPSLNIKTPREIQTIIIRVTLISFLMYPFISNRSSSLFVKKVNTVVITIKAKKNRIKKVILVSFVELLAAKLCTSRAPLCLLPAIELLAIQIKGV